MLHHSAYVIHRTSSHYAGAAPSHITRVTIIQYVETDYLHITSITVYCYDCSNLSLAFVVNLLLCLIYKLEFTIGMYVEGKKIHVGFSTIHGTWHPHGNLGMQPLRIRGNHCNTTYN